jgi:hypothetical protein
MQFAKKTALYFVISQNGMEELLLRYWRMQTKQYQGHPYSRQDYLIEVAQTDDEMRKLSDLPYPVFSFILHNIFLKSGPFLGPFDGFLKRCFS